MGNTQALPGLVAAGTSAAAPEPHEVIYEQALRRIAALDETWQEAVRGVAVPAPPAVPAPEPAPVRALGRAPVPPLPPLPRPPVPATTAAMATATPTATPTATATATAVATAEITAIAGPGTAEAVLARAASPRWRRSLAY